MFFILAEKRSSKKRNKKKSNTIFSNLGDLLDPENND